MKGKCFQKILFVSLLLVPVILLAYGVRSLVKIGDNTGYAPKQPIPFSHKLHAGDNQIPCQYCHVGVDKSKHAVVPPMNVCMNCHQVVKLDSPYIQKLREMYENGEAIEWIKVHDLPDHVRFTHERHIAAGLDCTQCHGDVGNMERVEQVETLQMGFCIDCHRKKDAPTHCESCHY